MRLTACVRAIGWLLLIVSAPVSMQAQNSPAPALKITVDETEAPRRLAFVHEELRSRPGALTLAYPKWIPGEHGPSGPLNQLASLQIHAGTRQLAWARDPDDIFTFHVDVPPGADGITLDYAVLMENTTSDHQLLLSWHSVVLYPRDGDKNSLMVEPAIVLPAGWKHASALRAVGQQDRKVTFAPMSLERLIDSPILAGEFMRVVPLHSTWPADLAITGDSQAAIDKADDAHAFSLFGALIDEDRAMFGFRHWNTLHLLLSQSSARPYDGLEHEDSPYMGMTDAGLSRRDQLEEYAGPLLTHEQAHSWIGKFRRAAEMYSKPDYQGPERTSLLWVYEGLNEYVSFVLGTRAGFTDAAYLRDVFASWAASFSAEPARASVPLVDTATDNWILRGAGSAWASLRRGQDYYNEGALIWLRADTIIREQTQGNRSLDDFLRAFFGQRDTEPIVAPYSRADVEAALSQVCPYDWHTFFETRVYQVNSAPPVDGLEAAGWKLVYNDTPNRDRFLSPGVSAGSEQRYSIGAQIADNGGVMDVLPGSPAYQAGLGPRMTIVSVNGQAFSITVLADAIAQPVGGKVSLVVRNFESVRTYEVAYPGGLRYPHLERVDNRRDLLTDIFRAHRP